MRINNEALVSETAQALKTVYQINQTIIAELYTPKIVTDITLTDLFFE